MTACPPEPNDSLAYNEKSKTFCTTYDFDLAETP